MQGATAPASPRTGSATSVRAWGRHPQLGTTIEPAPCIYMWGHPRLPVDQFFFFFSSLSFLFFLLLFFFFSSSFSSLFSLSFSFLLLLLLFFALPCLSHLAPVYSPPARPPAPSNVRRPSCRAREEGWIVRCRDFATFPCVLYLGPHYRHIPPRLSIRITYSTATRSPGRSGLNLPTHLRSEPIPVTPSNDDHAHHSA